MDIVDLALVRSNSLEPVRRCCSKFCQEVDINHFQTPALPTCGSRHCTGDILYIFSFAVVSAKNKHVAATPKKVTCMEV